MSHCGSSVKRGLFVPVLVVDVRIMQVTVGQRRVGVLVSVRFAPVPIEIVRMLVMFIVHMAVRVGDRLVGVQVLVTFGQM